MPTNNSKTGRETENKICELLSSNGWWVHLFQRNIGGQQPCDIVALKNGRGILIDAKHCEKSYLATFRIESNQIMCFEMAKEKGIECYFACYHKSKVYAIPWSKVNLNKSFQRWERGLLDEIDDIE